MSLSRDAKYFDNLTESKRNILRDSMRKVLGTGESLGKYGWNIPNDDHPGARATYGFPRGAPRVWMTLCDWGNRWALCIALAGARSHPDEAQPIDVAFELTFYKEPKDVRLNFHLREETDGRIQMRCKGVFSFRGAVRHSADEFFSHLKKRKSWSVDARIEIFQEKSYFLLYELPSADLTLCWDDLWPSLEEFAIVVEDFKCSAQGISLKHVHAALGRLPSGKIERLSRLALVPEVHAPEERKRELARKYPRGESQAHAALKDYLARHPEALGLNAISTRMEYRFATSDRVDLLVREREGNIHAVEVEIGGDSENRVGMMQALKYRALLSPTFDLAENECCGILAAYSISSQARALCERFGIRAVEVSSAAVKAMTLGGVRK